MKSLKRPSNPMASLVNLTCTLGVGQHFYNNLPPFQEVCETLDVFARVTVRGRVLNDLGLPVSGVLVEMWHAAHAGCDGLEYGPAIAPVDPDQQGWACTITNERGEYCFHTDKRTNQPGLQSASIHLKITDEDANVTLTKLYFDEDLLDPADYFLMDMELEERSQYMGTEKNGTVEFDIQVEGY